MDEFVTEVIVFVSPHVEIAPYTDPFVTSINNSDTYCTLQNLFRLETNDTQARKMSTLHVNDFLKSSFTTKLFLR